MQLNIGITACPGLVEAIILLDLISAGILTLNSSVAAKIRDDLIRLRQYGGEVKGGLNDDTSA